MRQLRKLPHLFSGDSVGIRTQDPQLRRLLLYPTELPNRSLLLLGGGAGMPALFPKVGAKICFLFEMSKEKEDYKAVASKEEILELLLQIRSAAEELDMDSVTDILAAFGAYELSERSAEIFAALENAVQDYDVETCEALVDEWEELIKM